jgi:thioredoxin-related protein
MKKNSFVLAIAIVLLASAAFSQDYNSALREARKGNKPLLLYFFSKSCYYCTLMDKTLADKDVAAILKKDFVFLRVDVDKSEDLGRLYRISGTPSSWFLESSGERVGQIPGYVDTGNYKHILDYVRGRHYREMDLQAYLKNASAGR